MSTWIVRVTLAATPGLPMGDSSWWPPPTKPLISRVSSGARFAHLIELQVQAVILFAELGGSQFALMVSQGGKSEPYGQPAKRGDIHRADIKGDIVPCGLGELLPLDRHGSGWKGNKKQAGQQYQPTGKAIQGSGHLYIYSISYKVMRLNFVSIALYRCVHYFQHILAVGVQFHEYSTVAA